MFVREALALLAGIHQTAVTDAVDASGNPGGFLIDLINGFIGKDFCSASGIIQMGTDIQLSFCPVKVWQDAVDVNSLADCRIALQPQFFPELCGPMSRKSTS